VVGDGEKIVDKDVVYFFWIHASPVAAAEGSGGWWHRGWRGL